MHSPWHQLLGRNVWLWKTRTSAQWACPMCLICARPYSRCMDKDTYTTLSPSRSSATGKKVDTWRQFNIKHSVVKLSAGYYRSTEGRYLMENWSSLFQSQDTFALKWEKNRWCLAPLDSKSRQPRECEYWQKSQVSKPQLTLLLEQSPYGRTTHQNVIRLWATQRAWHLAYLWRGLSNFTDCFHSSQLPVPILAHKHRRYADIVVCEVSLGKKRTGRRLPFPFSE